MGEEDGASQPCPSWHAGSRSGVGGRWWGQAIALALVVGASAARADPGLRLTSSHHRHSASPNGGRAALIPAFTAPARATHAPTLRRATCSAIPFAQRGAPRIGTGFGSALPRLAMQMQAEGGEQTAEAGVDSSAAAGMFPGKMDDMYKDLVSSAGRGLHSKS